MSLFDEKTLILSTTVIGFSILCHLGKATEKGLNTDTHNVTLRRAGADDMILPDKSLVLAGSCYSMVEGPSPASWSTSSN